MGLSRVARGQRKFVRLYAARALQRFETRGDSSSPPVEPAVVSHPRRGNFGKRRVACVEPGKAMGLLTGWSRTAGLSSGRWRPSPRVGYHVLEIGVSVHTVVLRLPDNGRNLVAPGCVECRAL